MADEKRRKKKEAYDRMLRNQEERVLAIERHRKEQEAMQGRQEEHLDQEREEKRIADQLRDDDRKMAKERARRREEFRRHRIETERAGEYCCLYFLYLLWQLIYDFTNIYHFKPPVMFCTFLYTEKNARADEIIAERERLKNQRINSRIQGMKKRAEVTEMFEKVRCCCSNLKSFCV